MFCKLLCRNTFLLSANICAKFLQNMQIDVLVWRDVADWSCQGGHSGQSSQMVGWVWVIGLIKLVMLVLVVGVVRMVKLDGVVRGSGWSAQLVRVVKVTFKNIGSKPSNNWRRRHKVKVVQHSARQNSQRKSKPFIQFEDHWLSKKLLSLFS